MTTAPATAALHEITDTDAWLEEARNLIRVARAYGDRDTEALVRHLARDRGLDEEIDE